MNSGRILFFWSYLSSISAQHPGKHIVLSFAWGRERQGRVFAQLVGGREAVGPGQQPRMLSPVLFDGLGGG